MLFVQSCSSDEESKVMSQWCAHQNGMQETLRGVIPSCNLHAALHCRLSMLMLQGLHRCYYVLMACSTLNNTPHCIACCMCMHRLPMCISGRERWGWALELRSEVTLKFCTYESCSISKYTVVWGPRWYHYFLDFVGSQISQISEFPGRASSILLQYFSCHR